MELVAFNACCPFEIGDKVILVSQSVGKSECLLQNAKTITDIACIHYVKNGTIEFRYELDNSGEYQPIQYLTSVATK